MDVDGLKPGTPGEAGTGGGAGAVPPAPARPRVWKTRGFKTLLSLAGLLVVIGACAAGYARATNYGKRVVEAHPVDARIEIVNAPAFLDRRIVNALLEEAYQFAQKDETTYNRARNTLDGEILRDFADLYTGTQASVGGSGGTVSRQTLGYNAWIKKVTQVRREVARDKSMQVIQIAAEWRQPAVWIRVGDGLCLIDGEGTRLPGDYRLQDRAGSKLMVLAGVELPATGGGGGRAAVPQPGEKWVGANGALGDDLAAGMQLADVLRRQPYAAQIDAIDVSNEGGRRNALAPWMVLDTVWQTAGGQPRVVQWGRPIGQEKFYEVQSAVKLKTLNELFVRFNRIDAGRDYVDIRTEVVRLPKLAQAN